MKSILIRNIDEKILSRLKKRANNHHRSLQGELHSILEKAALSTPASKEMGGLDLKLVTTDRKSTWSRQEIYGNQDR